MNRYFRFAKYVFSLSLFMYLLLILVDAQSIASSFQNDKISFSAPHHPLDRIFSEIKFVQKLAEMHPDKYSDWNRLIIQAENIVLDIIAEADKTQLSQTIAKAEKLLTKAQGVNIPEINDQIRKEYSGKSQFEQFIAKTHLMQYQVPQWSDRRYLNLAKDLVFNVVSIDREDRIINTVLQAEQILAPLGKIAKTFTLHCIGHSHIDMNWLWSWPETVALTNDTFITILKLMDEFPEFYYTQSQVAVYEIIRKYNPDLFEQIKQRVVEGRWEIVASQWVEGDKNLVSGESLVRQLLYSRRYIKAHFGLEPEDVPIDWEPDTFGHAWTIPAIVSRGAVKHYYLCRGGSFKKPSVFWWQAPDGSRVLVNVENESWFNGSIGMHNALTMLDFFKETGIKDWMNVYGVGDHGGGPTRLDIRRCLDMDSWPIFPHFEMTTTKAFYSKLEKISDKFPIIDQELNFEFTGCYTSQSQIKKFNRFSEHRAQEAEVAAVLAHQMLGRDYPAEKIQQAWTNTLFGHFHDILPGSNTHLSREYQSGLSQEALAITGLVKTNALRDIAAQINTAIPGIQHVDLSQSRLTGLAMGAGVGKGSATGGVSLVGHMNEGQSSVIIFNPTAWARKDVITTTLWDASYGTNLDELDTIDFIIRTSEGESFPAQKIGAGRFYSYHNYVDVSFPISVNALGYTTYVIEPTQSKFAHKETNVMDKTGPSEESLTLENDHLFIEFDHRTGGISKLVEKSTGIDMADSRNPLATLEFIIENGGNAWRLAKSRERTYPLYVQSMEKSLTGPYCEKVTAHIKLKESTIDVIYKLKTGQPFVEIDIEAMWLEIGSKEKGTPTLRIQFPFAVDNAVARYEIPYGSIERQLNAGEEVPGLRWADVAGIHRGTKQKVSYALLNDCKHGHSLDGSTLRLTLIRSTIHPDPIPEVGQHSIRMALLPKGKILKVSDLKKHGYNFNHPLQVVNTEIHQGKYPSESDAIIDVDSQNVLLTAIKKAENNNDIILRFLETDGISGEVNVQINDLYLGKATNAIEVDILERPLNNSTVKLEDNIIIFNTNSYGITSIRMIF